MRFGKDAKNKILIFLAISLGIHLLFILGAPFFPGLPFGSERESDDVLTVDLDPEMLKQFEQEQKRQIVNTGRSEDSSLPKEARYLGERNQSVQKETKARTVDTFRQGGVAGKPGQGLPSLTLKKLSPEQNLAIAPRVADGDMEAKRKIAQQQDAQSAGGGVLNAANNDHLADVKEGDKTLLSTKEFKYFGYYNRIRSKLDQAWYKKLRGVFNGGAMLAGRTIASNQSYYTRVMVQLDRHGRITSVQLLEKSGARDLDRAAIEAFNQAGPFPDPPSGLIDKDGTISVPWGFVVST